MNLHYIALFYVIPLVLAVFLVDIIWFRGNRFLIDNQIINSGWKGIVFSFRMAFGSQNQILRSSYGSDIFMHILTIRVFLKGMIKIYFTQIILNVIFELISKQQIDVWAFTIYVEENSYFQYKYFCQSILISWIIIQIIFEIRNQLMIIMKDFVNDQQNQLQIRTILIHTFQEDGLQIINEVNYFLEQINNGKIIYYQLLDNHSKKQRIVQKEQFLSYMKTICIDQQLKKKKNCFIPKKYFNPCFYNNQSSKHNSKLKNYDFEQFSGAILICLEQPNSVKLLIENFQKNQQSLQLKDCFKNSEYEQMIIQKDISYIIWENVKHRHKWELLKNVCINFFAIFVILFLTTPSTLIHLVSIDKETQKINQYLLNSDFQRFLFFNLQSLLVIAFNQLLLFLIRKIAVMESHICLSNLQISLFWKSTRYLLLNMLIMPFVAIQTTDSLYFVIFKENLDLKTIISKQFFVEQSNNFLIIVFQSGYFAFINGILRIDELAFNYFSPQIAMDIRSIQKKVDSCFDYGYINGVNISIFAIIIFFSSKVPLICFAGIFFYFFRIMIDTFNLSLVYKQEMESNGQFTQEIIKSIIYIACMYQLYSACYLYYLKEFLLASILIAYSVLFYIFLNKKLNNNVYFQQIDKLKAQKIKFDGEDRIRWKNIFKNPSQKDEELDFHQINV